MKKNGTVSVKDIAEKMNISLSTVNKALTGKSGISEKRRREVLAVAKEMGYECNRIAQSLARNPITIGVIFPDKWSDYYRAIDIGMREEFKSLAKYKVKSSVYFTSEKDVLCGEDLKEWIVKEDIKAIILCASAHESADVVEKTITTFSLPVFQVGEEQKYGKMISNVVTNVVMAGNLAANFLNCIYGENIRAVVLTGFKNVGVHREKAESFKKSVEKAGGIVYATEETFDEPEKAYEVMKDLYKKHPDINAVYASTAISSYACKFIDEKKLKDKVVFIGTDMFESLKAYMKKDVIKATIFQNQEKLGATVVRSAYDYIVEKNSFGYENVSQVDKIIVNPVIYLKTNIEEE